MSIRKSSIVRILFLVACLSLWAFATPTKKTLNVEQQQQAAQDEQMLEHGPYGSIGVPAVPEPIKDQPIDDKETAVAVAPYDDQKYKEVWSIPNRDELRAQRFGVSKRPKPLVLTTMRNGQLQDSADLEKTIVAVLHRLPHIKTNKDVVATVMEIFMAETCLGQYTTGSGQYGLAQYRIDSAKHLLEWTKLMHEDVYDSLMDLYDRKKSLKDNLISNVPFNVAMCVTYFWHRVPDYRDRIATREERAVLWKVAYNTHLGKGTVNKYLQRCEYAESKRYAGFRDTEVVMAMK